MGNYHCCPTDLCGADLTCGEYVDNPFDCPTTTYACQTTACCDPGYVCDAALDGCTTFRFTQPECERGLNFGPAGDPVVCPIGDLNPDDNLVAVQGSRFELDLLPPFKCCSSDSCGVTEMAEFATDLVAQVQRPSPIAGIGGISGGFAGDSIAIPDDVEQSLQVDSCIANTDNTKEACIAAVASAFQELEDLVGDNTDVVSTVAHAIIDTTVPFNSCVNVPPGQSDCSTLSATPYQCPTGICCTASDCSEGCYFGDYTECECAAMDAEMFVCKGIGTCLFVGCCAAMVLTLLCVRWWFDSIGHTGLDWTRHDFRILTPVT